VPGAFRRAGLPLLIEDYSAREDVFTRALPFLTLWFAAELLNALNFSWSTAANIVAVLVGLVVLLTPFALLNRYRGQRLLSRPQRVGNVELAIFLLVPPVLPLLGGGQLLSALNTVLGNAFVLLLVYGVVALGLLSIVRWSLSQLLSQLVGSLSTLARAIPLLLFFALLLFLNTEMWQVFGAIGDGDLIGVVILFVGIGSLFLTIRLPGEVRQLEQREQVQPPLSGRQRFNVGLVMFVSYSLQTLVISLAIGAFFVCFGLLTIPDSLIATWMGDSGHVVTTIHALGTTTVITRELLRVAIAIAAFSGLYYAISVLTDATYRREFLGAFERSIERVFALRSAYLARRTS
jgi:hypothetical protein